MKTLFKIFLFICLLAVIALVAGYFVLTNPGFQKSLVEKMEKNPQRKKAKNPQKEREKNPQKEREKKVREKKERKKKSL